MAKEQRLIDANELLEKYWQLQLDTARNFRHIIENAPTVEAVVLPYAPRPMLKDSNPFNTDVYCPECGTNLSGYYGGRSLPIVTCFNCGEILDPYSAVVPSDGERRTDGA